MGRGATAPIASPTKTAPGLHLVRTVAIMSFPQVQYYQRRKF